MSARARSTRSRLPAWRAGAKWSGNTTPSSVARRRNGKPVDDSLSALGNRIGRRELDGQLEVDVEELGPQLHAPEVGSEVADVEAPHDGPLDLGPALAADLVEVGVVPQVVDACAGTPRRRRAATAPG